MQKVYFLLMLVVTFMAIGMVDSAALEKVKGVSIALQTN